MININFKILGVRLAFCFAFCNVPGRIVSPKGIASCSALVVVPRCLPCGRRFRTEWCSAVDHDSLWEWEWIPSALCADVWVLPWRGNSQVNWYKDHQWHHKKHYPTFQDLPLISLFPYLVKHPSVASGDGVHLLCTWVPTENGRLFESLTINIPMSHCHGPVKPFFYMSIGLVNQEWYTVLCTGHEKDGFGANFYSLGIVLPTALTFCSGMK